MADPADPPRSVLFVCTMNSVRSVMASGILGHLAGQRIRVASAGVRIGDADPFVAAVMDEIGIDATRHCPRLLADIGDETYDLIVTLSPEAHHWAKELTRVMPAEVEYWPTLDATATAATGNRRVVLEAYRGVRDRLFERVKRRFAAGGGPSV